VPLVIFIALAMLYTHLGQMAIVHGALSGISAAAAGFVITVAIRLTRPYRRRPWAALFGAASFIGMAVLKLPLILVLLVLSLPSIAVAWWVQARQR